MANSNNIEMTLLSEPSDLPKLSYKRRSVVRRFLAKFGFVTPEPYQPRSLYVGKAPNTHLDGCPPNVVRNQKYNIFTFLPLAILNEFRFFYNMYFLVTALTQFYPPLQVGLLWTFISPLGCVVAVAIIKEAYDDIQRYKRDGEANAAEVTVLDPDGTERKTTASELKCGSIIVIHPNQRVPADAVVLRTTSPTGSFFVRTDQLDGETDWKLRFPCPSTQSVPRHALSKLSAVLNVDAPSKEIYQFTGKLTHHDNSRRVDALGLEHTVWTNCVVASDTVTAVVIFTGEETRAAMNASSPAQKNGLLDHEINRITKILFAFLVVLSFVLVAGQHFRGTWFFMSIRFILLFSSIVPLSLRVNLDMAKTIYTFFIMRDTLIEGTVVRSSNLPEELGRVRYLFSDKTGTLTKNEMVFKKFFLSPQLRFDHNDMVEVSSVINSFVRKNKENLLGTVDGSAAGGGTTGNEAVKRRGGDGGTRDEDERSGRAAGRPVSGFTGEEQTAAMNALLAMSLCHNVTPVANEESDEKDLQASSPDEVSIVKYVQKCGVLLDSRTPQSIKITFMDQPAEGEGSGGMWGDADYTYQYGTEQQQQQHQPSTGMMKNGSGAARRSGDDLFKLAVTKEDLREGKRASSPILGLYESDFSTNVSPRTVRRRSFSEADQPTATVVSSSGKFSSAEAGPSRQQSLSRRSPIGTMEFDILHDFPFSSARKRMGIVLRNRGTGQIIFYMKGADVVMTKVVENSDWLDEECTALAQEGLRTLVFGSRVLSEEDYEKFKKCYEDANLVMGEARADAIARVLDDLERGLKLIGLSGVEDKLQDDVEAILEMFRHAGIKVWMLTGDKVETALCIGRSARLIFSRQEVHVVRAVAPRPAGSGGDRNASVELGYEVECSLDGLEEAIEADKSGFGIAMIVDGTTLELILHHSERRFVTLGQRCSAVIVARCSPTQKAEVVEAVKRNTTSATRLAAIGDGGNDVSMIQAAHLGVGIVGKEGKHASLAADFSINQFSHVFRLFMWHGRTSYQRSCRLAQFIIHRGVIISLIQAIFSLIFYFTTIAMFGGFLLVGYTTIFTMLPIFCLCLDEDVSEQYVRMFPELYREQQKSRALNTRTLLQWMWVSFYQAGIIMLGAILMGFQNYQNLVTLVFSCLIVNELIGVALEMHFKLLYRQRQTHLGMFIVADCISVIIYFLSFAFVPALFDQEFVRSAVFWGYLALISAASLLPVHIFNTVVDVIWPSTVKSLQQIAEHDYRMLRGSPSR